MAQVIQFPSRPRCFLFEYEHDGARWALTVEAATPEEAKARVVAMGSAEHLGEIAEIIPA